MQATQHTAFYIRKKIIKSNSLFTSIRNKIINEINVYCGSYLPDWRPETNYKNIYSSYKNKGGGVHLDLFHEVDFIYWIFGNPDTIYNFLSNKSDNINHFYFNYNNE